MQYQSVVLTGKGYPDFATREMLRFLSSASPCNGFNSPPVYGLVDFDPDGIGILSVYKHGSANPAPEVESLTVPGIRRMGLHSSHVRAIESQGHTQGLLQLTGRDRRKARSMLQRPLFAENGLQDDWRSELQTMLMLNVKAELQILDETPDALANLLRDTVAEQYM